MSMGEVSDEAMADAIRRIQSETKGDSHAQLFGTEYLEGRRLDYEQRFRSVRLATLSVALLGVLSSTIAVTYQFLNWDKKTSALSDLMGGALPKKFATSDQVDKLRSEIPDWESVFKRAKTLIAKQRETDNSQGLDYLQYSALESSVIKIDSRLSVLERSISDNPEKALSIPMLRKDQENMAKSIEANRVAVAVEVDRIYDMQKWILGGIGTVLFAVVTALFAALYKAVMGNRDGDG